MLSAAFGSQDVFVDVSYEQIVVCRDDGRNGLVYITPSGRPVPDYDLDEPLEVSEVNALVPVQGGHAIIDWAGGDAGYGLLLEVLARLEPFIRRDAVMLSNVASHAPWNSRIITVQRFLGQAPHCDPTQPYKAAESPPQSWGLVEVLALAGALVASGWLLSYALNS